MAAEQVFVIPQPLDGVQRVHGVCKRIEEAHVIRDSQPELVCTGAAMDITWWTTCICDGCLVQVCFGNDWADQVTQISSWRN